MKVKVIAMILLLLSLATNVMGQEGKYNLGRGYRAFVEIEEMGKFGVIFKVQPYHYFGHII